MASTSQSDSTPLSQTLAPILAYWKHAGARASDFDQAQEQLGWLSQETIAEIALGLSVPLAKAYGVADFYTHLHTHPVGKTIVRVCDDILLSCRGEKICAALSARYAAQSGEITVNGAFTFEIVPCLGHCEHAPAVMIGGLVHEQATE